MGAADELNRRMVESLRADADMSPLVESAFRQIPRHRFLPGEPLETVYSGEAIPIKYGSDALPVSASSEPTIMATMLTQLDVHSGARVLEVGTGSGYNAALLSSLVGEAGRVTTIDIEADLVDAAIDKLAGAGINNVRAVTGDGWNGDPNAAPYDRIEVTVGVWDLSPRWVEQLAEGGVLVVPLWLRAGVQATVAFRRVGERLVSQSVRPCGFMRLRGPHAGPESYATIDGWIVCIDGDEGVPVDAIRKLLAEPMHASPAPELVDGWFLDVALKDPYAVQMWTTEEYSIGRQGVMLPDASGLALIEDDQVLTFGSYRATDHLRVAIARATPMRLEDLHIQVVPSVGRRDGQSRPDLIRPNYTYMLT
jgi:protein-L-isoaspartate(D-aspartate) O-methyltransferase